MGQRLTNGKLRLRNGKLAIVSITQAGANSTLTGLADYAPFKVFQRIGTSRDLTVNLVYTTTAPASIEVQLVDFVTNAVKTTWTPLSNYTASNGNASGKFTAPQGGPYKLLARDPAATATVVSSTQQFGVGVVIGMIGQSNMANMPTTAWYYPIADYRTEAFNRAGSFYRCGRINDARPANESSELGSYTEALSDVAGQGGVNGDGFIFFANLVAEGLGVPICLVERAVRGSAIESWQAGQSNWSDFAAAIAASGGEMEAAIWYQGESNATGIVANSATYRANLANVHQQCMTLAGRNTSNFHFGVVSLSVGSYQGSVEGEFGAMRALQIDYASNTAGAFLACNPHDCYTGDGVHIVKQSYNRVGIRAAKSLLKRFGVGVGGIGPRITGATRSGNVVTVAITHNGGTSLMDGNGGTVGDKLTGFEFKDAGAGGATISYTSAFSGNSIVLTLASTPVGALSMSYAMMNVPHGTSSTSATVLESIPCDNNIHLKTAAGSPLQPCAAFTVT